MPEFGNDAQHRPGAGGIAELVETAETATTVETQGDESVVGGEHAPVIYDEATAGAESHESLTAHSAAYQPDEPCEDIFEPILRHLDDAQRAEVVAAYVAVEQSAEPVPEVRLAALREPAARRRVSRLLAQVGRTLVKTPQGWTSGFADDVASVLAGENQPHLGRSERAVLTLVLVHSVAIPRSQNKLTDDAWLSPYPTALEELQRRSMLGVGELDDALRRLRTAGLVSQVKAAGDVAGGYVPGPQFHRLTPRARTRLQEDLILAAGPDSPLSASIRARRQGQTSADSGAAAAGAVASPAQASVDVAADVFASTSGTPDDVAESPSPDDFEEPPS